MNHKYLIATSKRIHFLMTKNKQSDGEKGVLLTSKEPI